MIHPYKFRAFDFAKLDSETLLDLIRRLEGQIGRINEIKESRKVKRMQHMLSTTSRLAVN